MYLMSPTRYAFIPSPTGSPNIELTLYEALWQLRGSYSEWHRLYPWIVLTCGSQVKGSKAALFDKC